MIDRDCNTCRHHVQGGLNEAPPRCWDCIGKGGHGHFPLPLWQAHEDDATSPAPVPGSSPLQTQVGGGHYKGMKIQPIEFCMANELNACQSKAIKYLCRTKGGLEKKLEDLDKAIHVIGIYKQMLQAGTVKL